MCTRGLSEGVVVCADIKTRADIIGDATKEGIGIRAYNDLCRSIVMRY